MKTSRRPTLSRDARRFAAALAATALFASLAGLAASRGKKPEAKAPDAAVAEEAAPPTKPDTVRILIQTVPARRASVKWGGKLLGTIPAPRPLVVDRPRDSGPLDLVIRAAGFLPVHTRAYTFSNSRVAVKLTPPSEKNKLFGYREAPPPPLDGGVPDAGPAARSPAPTPGTP